jgi:hypothetical protein
MKGNEMEKVMKYEFSIKGWEKYSNKPAPVFKSQREAQRVASVMREMRAWVEVIKVGE